MSSDQAPPTGESADELMMLRERTAQLEKQLEENSRNAEVRLIQAELKVEAVRAGIVDLDGLKLLDASSVTLEPDGRLNGVTELFQSFRATKPWLFDASFSSRPVKVPPSQPPRTKSAIDMSDDEYATARAAVLKNFG